MKPAQEKGREGYNGQEQGPVGHWCCPSPLQLTSPHSLPWVLDMKLQGLMLALLDFSLVLVQLLYTSLLLPLGMIRSTCAIVCWEDLIS